VIVRPLDGARDALIALQGQLIAMLAAQNAALTTRVAELEERLARLERAASRNSGRDIEDAAQSYPGAIWPGQIAPSRKRQRQNVGPHEGHPIVRPPGTAESGFRQINPDRLPALRRKMRDLCSRPHPISTAVPASPSQPSASASISSGEGTLRCGKLPRLFALALRPVPVGAGAVADTPPPIPDSTVDTPWLAA
jgi:hypothetical protein